MYKFELLSVAEDRNKSDRITGSQEGLTLSIDKNSRLTINLRFTEQSFVLSKLDIDCLILFLQDAKQFIEEHKVIEKLKGE